MLRERRFPLVESLEESDKPRRGDQRQAEFAECSEFLPQLCLPRIVSGIFIIIAVGHEDRSVGSVLVGKVGVGLGVGEGGEGKKGKNCRIVLQIGILAGFVENQLQPFQALLFLTRRWKGRNAATSGLICIC